MSKLKEFTDEELETRGVDGFINITKGTTGVSMQKSAIASGKKRGLKYNEEYGLVAEAKTEEAAKKLFDTFIKKYDLEPLEGKKKKTIKKAPAKVPAKVEKQEEDDETLVSQEEEEKPLDKGKITIPKLKEYLKKNKIEFTSKMKKDELYDLYVESFDVKKAPSSPQSKKKAPSSPKAKEMKEEDKDQEEGEDDEETFVHRPASIKPVSKPAPKVEKKAPVKAPPKVEKKGQPKSPREIVGLEGEISFPGEVIPAKKVPIVRPPPSEKPKLTKEQKFERLLKCWTESKVEVTKSPRSPGRETKKA